MSSDRGRTDQRALLEARLRVQTGFRRPWLGGRATIGLGGGLRASIAQRFDTPGDAPCAARSNTARIVYRDGSVVVRQSLGCTRSPGEAGHEDQGCDGRRRARVRRRVRTRARRGVRRRMNGRSAERSAGWQRAGVPPGTTVWYGGGPGSKGRLYRSGERGVVARHSRWA